LKQQFNFFKLFQIKQIVIKRKETKFKEKKSKSYFENLKGQTWKSRRRDKRIKRKEKVADAKIEVRWPYILPRYGGTIKMIWMSPE